MSAKEILFRLRQQLTLISLRLQFIAGAGIAKRPTDYKQFRFCIGPEPKIPVPSLDLEALQHGAVGLLRGDVPVAGSTWKWDTTDDIWYRAPDTGKAWPKRFFGSLNYREGNPYGDVRQLWEPSRLQHLLDLAMLPGAADRTNAAQLVRTQLISWNRSNPPLVGAHYVSAMECALRLIAVCHALDAMRAHLADDAVAWQALIEVVHSHAPLIEQRLSLHSSTGNHTMAEAAGLIYAGTLFPEMKRSTDWLTNGLAVMSETAQSQVLPDGGGIEQAFWYHRFNVDLLTLVQALTDRYLDETPEEIQAALNRGRRFLEAMGLAGGTVPMIGDSDGGYALSRYLRLQLQGEPVPQASRTFKDAGYTVAHIGSSVPARIILDHGPLGMAPSYGHGHADALNLQLSVNDEDVFIDPGTYTYTGDQDWRRYFRGTAAHNTVTVGGADQARQDGCFLWSHPYEAGLLASDLDIAGGGRLIAEHNGYRNLGIRHTRGVAWSRGHWLLVHDSLAGPGTHELDLHWHLASQPLWRDEENFDIKVGSVPLAICCRGGTMSTHYGETAPIAGWKSPAYGVVEPSPTLKLHYHGSLPHVFLTLIRFSESDDYKEATEDALKWIKERAC